METSSGGRWGLRSAAGVGEALGALAAAGSPLESLELTMGMSRNHLERSGGCWSHIIW